MPDIACMPISFLFSFDSKRMTRRPKKEKQVSQSLRNSRGWTEVALSWRLRNYRCCQIWVAILSNFRANSRITKENPEQNRSDISCVVCSESSYLGRKVANWWMTTLLGTNGFSNARYLISSDLRKGFPLTWLGLWNGSGDFENALTQNIWSNACRWKQY